jgi:hypothetical protein
MLGITMLCRRQGSVDAGIDWIKEHNTDRSALPRKSEPSLELELELKLDSDATMTYDDTRRSVAATKKAPPSHMK